MSKVAEVKTLDERKNELLEKGKKNGYITFEELAQALKGLEVDADTIDGLYNFFMENGISVITEDDIIMQKLEILYNFKWKNI